jgi:subtilisin family serine protease
LDNFNKIRIIFLSFFLFLIIGCGNDKSRKSLNFNIDTNSTTVEVNSTTKINTNDKDNDGVIDSMEYILGFVPGIKDADTHRDILYPYQWYLKNIQKSPSQYNTLIKGIDIDIENVWKELTIGDKNITVAVVDTGVDIKHPDLEIDLNKSFRYSDKSNNPSLTSEQLQNSEENAHGTACAGIIGAKGWNDIGIKGVAPNIDLVALNVFSDPSDLNFYYALSRLDVDISSNSWGGGNNYILFEDDWSLKGIKIGISKGRDGKGIIYVFASGNENANANFQNVLSSGYVIPVAAIKGNGRIAEYSDYGANILISAPGGAVDGEKYPAIVSTDLTTLQYGMDSYYKHWSISGNEEGDYTNLMNGTSAATPIVSAVAALMLSVNPNLTYNDVQYILAMTAKKIDIYNKSWKKNAAGILFSNIYGFGMIDAYEAVKMAKDFESLGQEINATNKFVKNSLDYNKEVMSVDINESFKVFKVFVIISTDYDNCGKLKIVLSSPNDTNSTLAYGDTILNTNYNNWQFLSFKFLNESSKGKWKLYITDESNNSLENEINATLVLKGFKQ